MQNPHFSWRRFLKYARLGTFAATAQQDHDRVSVASAIDPVPGSDMDAQLDDAFPNGVAVA